MAKNYDVGIYCRLSRDDNNGTAESMSISNQRDMLINYVNERGWNLVDEYVDDGFSGTNFERPDFIRMINDIKNGRINAVVVKDLSRLGRNYIQLGQYTDYFFPEHNVRCIAVNDNFDTENGDDDFAPFKNIINEWYAKDISRKVRAVRLSNARKGNFMGSIVPYGYMRSPEDKHKLIVDSNTAPIVQYIFSEVAKGNSARAIANKLNHDGVLSPRAYYYNSVNRVNPKQENTEWGSTTVYGLIKNPVYVGDMVQMKRLAPSFKSKRRCFAPKDSWVTVRNTHEALVDRETWELVQRGGKQGNLRKKLTKKDEISLFSGFLTCADCGSPLCFSTKRYSGREYEVYRCSKYADKGTSVCSIHSISLEELEKVVLADIRAYCRLANEDEEKLISELVCKASEKQRSDIKQNQRYLGKLNFRLNELETLMSKLIEEKLTGKIPDDIYSSMLSKYEAERKDLKAKADGVTADMEKIHSVYADVTTWVSYVKGLAEIKRLDREILSELVDNIVVSERRKVGKHREQDIKIKYKFVGCLS